MDAYLKKLPGGIIFRHHITPGSPGMYADLHCHNYFELIYVVTGDLAHVIEGRKYILHTDDLVLVQPSRYHYLQLLSDVQYERYNILFDPIRHGISESSELPKDLEVVNLSGNNMLKELFSKMDFYAEADEEDFERLLTLLLRELCMHLRIFSNESQRRDTVISQMLNKALEYISANLFTIKNVDEVAQELFISSSYLYRLFNTLLHQSPKKYIQEKRLLAAQRMIRAGGKPTEVSRECGFKEYTTFFRSYSAFFGHSPSDDCV